jgi:uncharacterized protein YndB with AHSA1/START domain
MAHYSFVMLWHFREPIERIWQAINAAEDYPRWWSNILDYECLTPENPRGVGAKGRRAVRGLLRYSLVYTTTITRTEAPYNLEYVAEGDLVGEGRFVLAATADAQGARATEVTLYWNVSTQGRRLNRFAPLLKWLFVWNHNYVMRRGERGLTKWMESGGG